MKAKRTNLSAIARELGCSKSAISRIWNVLQGHKFIQVPWKGLVVQVKQMQKRTGFCKDSQGAIGSTLKLEMLGSFVLNRATISLSTRPFKTIRTESPLTKPLTSRTNKKPRWSCAEEHVVWTEENRSKVDFSDECKLHYVEPLVQLRDRVNANGYLYLLQQRAAPFLQLSPKQPTIFTQDNALKNRLSSSLS